MLFEVDEMLCEC